MVIEEAEQRTTTKDKTGGAIVSMHDASEEPFSSPVRLF